ncbi:MAG: hypothetical protein VBE63_28165, partial [Lamprobacter sp.]|uniref:hypothetical protein n=1 Tax=Lamprobacter sp. TaxID=3100796 RepID=UPI002B2646C5
KFLKVHDLDVLVPLTGQEQRIKRFSSWSVAINWDESRRYEDPALATQQDAFDMLAAAKEFAEERCAISMSASERLSRKSKKRKGHSRLSA